ncbi:hypothetical protein SHELI_v1c05770 [Spiroplasma helicoides]|uniref:Uncharacterized protein n=1 Tax=Spiroplasma helicoides TaxID=216938 RepID=A0A1B3SKQ8_9MOLU|nr:hypothetical protein [Spiroplasma helicoides]AOG60528.1 hypothetical protein SHELI_v1c05770 [Spiroplasma helicoides]
MEVTSHEEDSDAVLRNIKWLIETFPKGYKFYPGHFDYGFSIRDVLEEDNVIQKRYLRAISKDI